MRSLGFALVGVALLAAGAVGGWLFESRRVGVSDKVAIEQVVHDYILEHPEILPEAVERLRQRETRKQLAAAGDEIEQPFPGAVLGNPQGKVTLVEFTDFACTYCRASVGDVKALIAANPDLRVVIRELPILSPQSADAARMALAAARQGRYAQFHEAMFRTGRPSAQTIADAASEAGLDMAQARKDLADPKIEAEISRNLEMARQLGFNGTPSWVVGEQIMSGAVGKEALAEAIDQARG